MHLLTVAHISPIVSLIAGVLILIMPRFLNFIVAAFLILNGMPGLGLLKWLHLNSQSISSSSSSVYLGGERGALR